MIKLIFEHSSKSFRNLSLHEFEDVIELGTVHDANYLRKTELHFRSIIRRENSAII